MLNEMKMSLLEALRIKPDTAPVHYGLALCYEKGGDYKSAVSELREVIRFDPSFPQAAEKLSALEGNNSVTTR